MKKQFRILAAALALCLSLLCCPAAFAAVDSSSCQTVPYIPPPLHRMLLRRSRLRSGQCGR